MGGTSSQPDSFVLDGEGMVLMEISESPRGDGEGLSQMKNRQQALSALSEQELRSEKAEYSLRKTNYCSMTVEHVSFATYRDLKKSLERVFC